MFIREGRSLWDDMTEREGACEMTWQELVKLHNSKIPPTRNGAAPSKSRCRACHTEVGTTFSPWTVHHNMYILVYISNIGENGKTSAYSTKFGIQFVMAPMVREYALEGFIRKPTFCLKIRYLFWNISYWNFQIIWASWFLWFLTIGCLPHCLHESCTQVGNKIFF